ncbi:hypothetical protein GTA28_28865 [Rhodococcus hoagii]|nr:hypothetical protein [Prescottella equi]
MQGPQHIDAIRTETSAADIGTREAGASAPAPSHAAPAAAPVAPSPTAPYPAGSPTMAAPAAAAQPAANTAPAPGGAAPAPTRQTLPDTGRHHRPDDGLAASGSQHLPSHSSSDTAAASMAAAAFLTLLRGPIAGAHTRLALLRTQQFTTNTVTASAIGTFETATGTTYVLATAHGVSYLSHDGAVPTDTRLLTELIDDTFYSLWCGYADPVTKLAAFASTDHTLGQLTHVLTSAESADLPGIEVVTQSLSDVQSITAANLLAPTSRSRRDIVLANDTDLGDAVRQMAMRTQVLRGDQYLHVLGRASGALWNHEADRAAYVEKWLQVLAADALRAVDRGAAAQAWFAVAEYKRASRVLVPQH